MNPGAALSLSVRMAAVFSYCCRLKPGTKLVTRTAMTDSSSCCCRPGGPLPRTGPAQAECMPAGTARTGWAPAEPGQPGRQRAAAGRREGHDICHLRPVTDVPGLRTGALAGSTEEGRDPATKRGSL